jgi:hypothetical protein
MGPKYNEKVFNCRHTSSMLHGAVVHFGQSFISFQHLPRSSKGESVKSNDIYIDIYTLHIYARESSYMWLASSFQLVFFVLFSRVVLNVVSSL